MNIKSLVYGNSILAVRYEFSGKSYDIEVQLLLSAAQMYGGSNPFLCGLQEDYVACLNSLKRSELIDWLGALVTYEETIGLKVTTLSTVEEVIFLLENGYLPILERPYEIHYVGDFINVSHPQYSARHLSKYCITIKGDKFLTERILARIIEFNSKSIAKLLNVKTEQRGGMYFIWFDTFVMLEKLCQVFGQTISIFMDKTVYQEDDGRLVCINAAKLLRERNSKSDAFLPVCYKAFIDNVSKNFRKGNLDVIMSEYYL